ncbi:MAG: hypothetical protein M3P24_02100 [Gemmatimonadota bacterium]|nr:hypothetical protein [Gemmatimonadota bacterium]
MREVFPDALVRVTGGYAATAPDHVRNVLGVEPLIGTGGDVQGCAADWSVAAARPAIGYVSTRGGVRTSEEIVAEIKDAQAHGIGCFAFSEHGLIGAHPALFRAVLEGVLSARFRRIRFVMTGTVSPGELAAEPDLPGLMYRAGYRQIFFADDREAPLTSQADEARVEDYYRVAALCHKAGFAARSDALSGGVSLGRKGEDLSARTQLITRIAHAIGSVVIWPYQPQPEEWLDDDLELWNGKFYPLRQLNGATYRDYLNVMGIAVVLNAKYREYTFDFLGDSLVARMLRDSLAREAWVPEPTLKGPIALPVLPSRRSA